MGDDMKNMRNLFFITFFIVPFFAHADTNCMIHSYISKVKIPNNSSTAIRMMPDDFSAANYAYRKDKYDDMQYISMWEGSSYERWKQKRDIILMAISMNKPVTVISKDDNCMGNDDEFDISIHLYQ